MKKKLVAMSPRLSPTFSVREGPLGEVFMGLSNGGFRYGWSGCAPLARVKGRAVATYILSRHETLAFFAHMQIFRGIHQPGWRNGRRFGLKICKLESVAVPAAFAHRLHMQGVTMSCLIEDSAWMPRSSPLLGHLIFWFRAKGAMGALPRNSRVFGLISQKFRTSLARVAER
jgi:hypothetical protein